LIVINHSDLFQITNAERLVELIIPVQQFTKIDQSFFHCHYNFNLLNSEEYIKYLMLNIIEQLSRIESPEISNVIEIISILNKAARIKQGYLYVPSTLSQNDLVNKVPEFIKRLIHQPICSQDISTSFYMSAPYISILLKMYLGIHFKHYLSSL